jgi:diadenosine tetraphosphate (Ap4A) HIT family hydrolase
MTSKKASSRNCDFCKVVNGNKLNHEIIWQDKKHIAFLDMHPTNNGHINTQKTC